MSLSSILAGIDLKATTDTVVETLAALDSPPAADITLVHACGTDVADWLPASEYLYDDEGWRARLSERLELVCHELRGRGHRVHGRLAFSMPAAALLEESAAASLIVVGTRHHSHVRRHLLGDTATRVVRTSERSVLVARPASGPLLRQVLVGTDFSDQADAALRLATNLVEDGGRIDVAHFWELPSAAHGTWVEGADSHDLGALSRLFEQAVVDSGARLTADHGADRYELVFHHERMSPREGMLRQIDRCRPGLVVVGARSRGTLKRLLLGSVAETLTHHAPCSVLIVREGMVAASRSSQ